jgi:hypothetical protein
MVCVIVAACNGDRPAVAPSIDPAPTAIADIAKTCARVASCADAHEPSYLRNPTACVDWWLVSTTIEADQVACLSKASSCKEVQACTHDPEDRGAIAYCTAHPGVLGVCDGTHLYNCSDNPNESSAVDCAALGGTCVEQRVAGGLVVRGCASSKLCPPGAPLARCEANAIVRCEDGLAERRECAKTTRCVPGGEEGASCEGQPVADRPQRCAKPGFASCQGDRVTFCALVGKDAWLRSTDCTRWGMTCGMRDGRAHCVARASTCTGDARCDGDALVFCAAGTEARVSCKALGFLRCDGTCR